jgi:hypothetical protein
MIHASRRRQVNVRITIDLTPGTARRLAWLSASLLLLGGAAVAYAVPNTFVSQQKLTAAQLNENFGHIDAQLTEVGNALSSKAEAEQIPVLTEWVAYSPILTTNKGIVVANQVTTGFYRRVGDALEARVSTRFLGPPASGAVWWQWSLPNGLTIDTDKVGPVGVDALGSGTVSNGSSPLWMVASYMRSSVGISISPANSASFHISDTSPVTLDKDALISFEFRVPIEGWGAM